MKTALGKRRVLIVDDHPVVREGLGLVIDQEPDLMICADAAGGPEALELMTSSKPDIIIADLGLEGMNGLELIKNIKSRDPHLPVLVISMNDESLFAERALRAGARGYLMKNESTKKVVDAIRQVLSGKVYLSDIMSEKMLSKMADPTTLSGSPMETLSDRELEVFQLIGKGLKPRQIAQQLSLSVKTIESYQEQIKLKLRLENASDLIQHAIEWTHSENVK